MDQSKVTTAHLADVHGLPVPWETDSSWLPLRRELGISSFGINAYVAREAGAIVVEEHDELGGQAGHHEELYVVMAGRASFTLDGDELDAPQGTFVAIHDPSVGRSARALEPGTTVLAVGGAPGEPYRVSPWEHSFVTFAQSHEGRHDEAVSTMMAALEAFPGNPALLYNLACYESLTGRTGEALGHLRLALEGQRALGEYAASDPDLDAVRDLPSFPGTA